MVDSDCLISIVENFEAAGLSHEEAISAAWKFRKELNYYSSVNNECVSRWISKLTDENKTRSEKRPRDQIIAIAYSKCRRGESASSSKHNKTEMENEIKKILDEYSKSKDENKG